MKKIIITPEKIAVWKAEHGENNIKKFVIPIDDNGEQMVEGYFRKPTLKALGMSGKFAETDPMRAGQLLYNECFLGSECEEFSTNEEVMMSCIKLLNGWFKVRVGEIKNV